MSVKYVGFTFFMPFVSHRRWTVFFSYYIFFCVKIKIFIYDILQPKRISIFFTIPSTFEMKFHIFWDSYFCQIVILIELEVDLISVKFYYSECQANSSNWSQARERSLAYQMPNNTNCIFRAAYGRRQVRFTELSHWLHISWKNPHCHDVAKSFVSTPHQQIPLKYLFRNVYESIISRLRLMTF